jgi:ferritin-like metal-binding protein YciE
MATKKTIVKKPADKIAPKKDAAKDLAALFEDGLKDLYWAEKALYTKALPKMLKNATDPKLKKAVSNHAAETKNHIQRLEACFAALGKKPQAKKCDAMQGLMDEGKGIIEECQPGSVRDAGIIAAAQKSEHYEIASYGTLAAFAKVLKQDKCLKLLLQTLKEEKNCDSTLTKIADTNLNTAAL